MENHNLMNGSGVAAGDFDNDGRCDLYFCAIDGTNTLYRNLGGMQFEDVTINAGVGCPRLHSTGAVFADVDGDGRVDLLVSTLGQGVHCFMNEGNGRFRESTAEAALVSKTGSTSLALADVDGDGTLDLYVANYGAMSLYRSGGSVQVRQENGRWVVIGPNSDRLRYVDGKIQEVGEADVLYLNNGHGHFRPIPWNSSHFLDPDGRPAPTPLDFGLSVQMRDINGDGFPDIYVCNDFASPDRIWINDGAGNFREISRLAIRKQSGSSMGVDFADIDRDGFLDFFTTEMRARNHVRQMQDIPSIQPQVSFKRPMDERTDVLRNVLALNRGDSTFADIAHYAGVPASDWSWTPVFVDVDLDGYEDLLVGNGMWFNVQDRDTLARIRSLGKQTVEQSRTNLALYPHYFSSNVAWHNRHDRTFEEVSAAWGFNAVEVSQGIACADLDNDGALDIVINCLNAKPLVYRNRTAAPRLAVRLRGKKPNTQGIGALVRVTGGAVASQAQEILSGGRYLSGDDPMRIFAAGSLTNELSIEVRWRSGALSRVSNVDPNRIYEIDEAQAKPPTQKPAAMPTPTPMFRDVTSSLNHSHHEQAFNDFARQPLLMKQLSQLGPGVAWLDLDNDGHDELIIGAGKGGSLRAFHFDEATRRFNELKAGASSFTAYDDLCGLSAWLTAEGRPAIVAAQARYESEGPISNSVFVCSAESGSLEITPITEVAAWGASAGPIAVADIDGDGALDLFVGGRVVRGQYPRATSSKLYRQRGGSLVLDPDNNKALESIGMVSGAVWSDLDGDGFPELLLACEWGGIRLFHNDHGRLAAATLPLSNPPGSTLNELTGWWSGITTGDFDGDGKQDIIVSNWGLNDAYRASREHPLRLYYGEGSDMGEMDLIESWYSPEINADVPCRTLDALGRAFPVLAGRYGTYEDFGRATLNQILSVIPRRFEVLENLTLQSMLFLNRGKSFMQVPLPAEAQFAPAFAVNVTDMDGDGHEDLFLSQNFFAVRPERDRQDAGRGLWLRGDGKGGLVSVAGQVSGVEVYGEQRGAAVGDFNEDGRADLVVTQNGAPTRLFENVAARPGMRVRLKGPPGNPSGIGAALRLEFPSGPGPARELHAGSGYWSQDSLVQVLACPVPPSKLQVVWPGGQTTHYEVQPEAVEVVADVQGGLKMLKRREQ